jgi:hypothetical protein
MQDIKWITLSGPFHWNFVISFLLLPFFPFSQITDSIEPVAKISVAGFSFGAHYGSVFAHSEEVQNTAGANPRGIELAFTKQRRDKGVVDLCNCYPRQGIVASYFNFDNEILGEGAMAGWMLEPTYRLGNKLQLGIRGVAGFIWMSNPFDSVKNPGNQSYSTDISAWLVVGASLSYPITEKWRVQLGANFEHTSNGGMKQPNKGVNYPTASLHLQYNPNPQPYYKGARNADRYWKGQPWRKDIGVFGTGKRAVNEAGVGTRKPIVGIVALGSKQVGRINGLTVGLEGYYDGYNAQRMETDTVGMKSAVRIGLMGGHEFLLGRFIFSQQLGVYLYKPAPYDKAWFHRWGIMTKINRHLWAGFNLKAHLQVADFVDVRLVYNWK